MVMKNLLYIILRSLYERITCNDKVNKDTQVVLKLRKKLKKANGEFLINVGLINCA